MKKFSKEKRQQLLLTGIITLTVLAGLWYGLIRNQKAGLVKIAERHVLVQKELDRVRSTIARADQIASDLEESSALLAKCEENMASGDIYAWAITRIRDFKAGYKIDIPQFSQIDGPKSMNLLPDFPYQQASLTVAGTGTYPEIGTFIADFENRYTFSRICNLVLEPASAGSPVDKEKLSFHMDVVMLVKPLQEQVN